MMNEANKEMMYTFKLMDTRTNDSTWMVVGCREAYEFLRDMSTWAQAQFAIGPVATITVEEAEEIRGKRTGADFNLLLSFNEFVDSIQNETAN